MALRTVGELDGLAVLTLSGGKRVGRVQDAVFQADGTITGFTIVVEAATDGGSSSGGGSGGAPLLFLPAERVHKIGADALTIEDAEGLSPQADATEGEHRSRALHGRTVINESGNAVGRVAEVRVDTAAVRVAALLITTGLLDRLLPGGKKPVPIALVRAIGADGVIVSDAFDPGAPEAANNASPAAPGSPAEAPPSAPPG